MITSLDQANAVNVLKLGSEIGIIDNNDYDNDDFNSLIAKCFNLSYSQDTIACIYIFRK